jgi:hypothetical protein
VKAVFILYPCKKSLLTNLSTLAFYAKQFVNYCCSVLPGRPRRTPKVAARVQATISTTIPKYQACVLVPHGPKFPAKTSGRAEKDSQPHASVASSMTSMASEVITAGPNANV